MSYKAKAHTKHFSSPPGMHSLEARESPSFRTARENSSFRTALEFGIKKPPKNHKQNPPKKNPKYCLKTYRKNNY